MATCGATRPMPPMRLLCLKLPGLQTCAPRAWSPLNNKPCKGCTAFRSLWMGTCTSRTNVLRGFCREFGIAIPQGARTGIEALGRVLADPQSAVPELIRHTAGQLLEEIRLLEARTAQVERPLSLAVRQGSACTLLLSVSGVGLLTATAMVAATSCDVTHFRDARHFSSWFGLSHVNIAPDRAGTRAASPKKATAICACCSCTARAVCSRRPGWPKGRARRFRDSVRWNSD